EEHGIALREGYHLGSRLRARSLLRDDEFSAREVPSGCGQQHGQLQGKNLFAVEVLMQAVVIARAILQQQRRGLRLTGGMAARQELAMAGWKAHYIAHALVPRVGERHE